MVLLVVIMGSCVVSGECWPTEVLRVLSVVARVVGWVGVRLVKWIQMFIF